MIEVRYWFLFLLALIWIIFASVQDIKKKEVANWLNYSLLVFALAYRGFYSLINWNYWFFVYGAVGAIVFAILANALYYSKIFGGGDARLLIGLGAILPFESFIEMIGEGFMFIFLLFLIGAVYSILFSFFVLFRNFDKFKIDFKKKIKLLLTLYALVIVVIIFIKLVLISNGAFYFLVILLLILPLLYVYLLALDKCMIKLTKPGDLQEGDWLNEEVKLGRGKVIRKSVHGLSIEDIKLLKKARKSVWVKEGVVFVPVFLISFIIYLWILSRYGGILNFMMRFLI